MVSLFVILFPGERHEIGGAVEIIRIIPIVFQGEHAGEQRLYLRQRLAGQPEDDQRLLPFCRKVSHCKNRLPQVTAAAGIGKVGCAVLGVETAGQIEVFILADLGVCRPAPCQVVGKAVFTAHKIRLFQRLLDPGTVCQCDLPEIQHSKASCIR